MADVTTYDGIVNAISNNNFGQQTFYEYIPAAVTGFITSGASGTGIRDTAKMKALPSPLPGSTTKYRPLYVTAAAGNVGPIQASFLVAKAINFGSVDVSVTSGGFTDGSAMPTRTELGTASSQTYGPMMAVVTTALGGTQGVITVTYTNAAGTTNQTTTFTPTNGSLGQGNIFWISGTPGVRDITNITRAGGTSPTGVIQFWGLLPLGMFTTTVNTMNLGYNFLTGGFNFLELGAGDQIKVITIGGTANINSIGSAIGQMWFMGET